MTVRSLSDYFVGVAAKRLSGTEVDPAISRGHEYQGVDAFREFLGTERRKLPVTYVWLSDDAPPFRIKSTGTWYDSREKQPHRIPEFRLYYPRKAEAAVHRARGGDTLFFCLPKDGPLLAIGCNSGSTLERQLRLLFGISPGEEFLGNQRNLSEERHGLDFASRFILEELGVEAIAPAEDAVDAVLTRFGTSFPSTKEFSTYARATLPDISPTDDPDAAILSWWEREEALFRGFERRLIELRLDQGFAVADGPDVEGFLSFSLSVHGRRKSRAGLAFANHIEAILSAWGVRYKREATTEKRAGPDFLFPGEAEYHDPSFPEELLSMLAAKTTCKDRWRQVTREAHRIQVKHLLTLEPGISVRQTDEMKGENLQLVVPSPLQSTYEALQQGWLLSVRDFIEVVREKEKKQPSR